MSSSALAVRIRLIPTEVDEGEDKIDHQVTIDLIIDKESAKVLGNHMLFGLYGSPVREGMTPFMLHPSGKVDFGDHAQTIDRFEQFNLRTRPIRVGEVTTWEGDYGVWNLRIVAVQEPTEIVRG